MVEYHKMKISEIINYESIDLESEHVEVEGIARGLQDSISLFGQLLPIGRPTYVGFLQEEDLLLLFEGNPVASVGATKELSMLRVSSEISKPVTLCGKLKEFKYPSHDVDDSKIQYKLIVSGVKLNNYTTVAYNK